MDPIDRKNANFDLVCLILSFSIVLIVIILCFLTEILTLFASCLRIVFTDNSSEIVTQAPVGNTDTDGKEASCPENIEMQQFEVTN